LGSGKYHGPFCQKIFSLRPAGQCAGQGNLGHRSKKVYGPNQPSIDALHEYVFGA
jgi:hypothetical protein